MTDTKVFSKVYLLCDCNNFFVSCEKIFRPDLSKRPVAVLSNNDGVVVSRSYETKALGIAMGSPVFKIDKEIKKYKISLFSSNFSLYLDISNRVMTLLERFCKDLEVYSVDEAFLSFENISEEEALAIAYKVKHAVATEVGIPVGIGIARTKTLAKLSNNYAKSHKNTNGVYSILTDSQRQRLLLDNPIKEVWGIGKNMEEHLLGEGFSSAYDLANADATYLGKKYSVQIERTIKELNNIDCIESMSEPQNQNQIMWSRSFKDRITSYDDLYEALSNYVAKACQKLRSLNKYAQKIAISIRTSYFGNKEKYSNEAIMSLDIPCADTRVFIAAARELLNAIYKDGYEYMKAGVVLFDFKDSREYQSDLFSVNPDKEVLDKSDNLMKTLDNINAIEPDTVYLGAQNRLVKQSRFNDPQHKSPRYTSSFKELPKVF